MRYLRQLALILLIASIGELLRGFIPLPIPAGIYGFCILFVCLCTGIIKLHQVENVADLMVEVLSLFLLPSCVSLMKYWTDMKDSIVPVLIVCLVSTAGVQTVTGKVSDFIIGLKEGRK